MTRNQKIALGCGGAGCLGIIVLIVLGVVLSAAGYLSLPGSTNRNYNFNVNNSNRNSNFNPNLNRNSSGNSNSSSSSSSSSTMSSDAKHRLYQAVGMTRDQALMLRVFNKIGLGDGTGSDHQAFIKEHFTWAMNNMDFIQSVNTPETARAYVEEHIDD
ncbi:MAG TPA: hypothetical protein VJV03_18195 [Pyrinomonadaceae bacterium]|nr:hypothetical protein [Pyrinomonadaceae bacterium]